MGFRIRLRVFLLRGKTKVFQIFTVCFYSPWKWIYVMGARKLRVVFRILHFSNTKTVLIYFTSHTPLENGFIMQPLFYNFIETPGI